jgi:hypothetical protein
MATPTDRYWAKKLAATPKLASKSAKITLTAASLEKEIRKAHRAGLVDGTKLGYEAGKLAKVTRDDLNSLASFFDQFTGE